MNKTLNSFNKIIDEIKNLKEVEVAYLTEPISKGKWSIREIIGHIYYWDKFNLEVMVPKMIDGEVLPEFPNHDQHNAEGIQYLSGQSAESIINTFIETRIKLVEDLANIPEKTRFRIGKGKRQYSAEAFTKIFLNHDLYHLKQINEKLNK